jgi:hypothetical protein
MKIEEVRMRGCCFAVMAIFAGIAQAAPAPGAGPVKNPAVTLEPMPGTNVKRVILAPKAAERLGIATAPVSEQPLARRQMVGGLVIAAMDGTIPEPKPAGGFAGFARTGDAPGFAQRVSASGGAVQAVAAGPAASAGLPKPVGLGSAWVSVSLSSGEWERVAKDKPVRILPLATRQPLQRDLMAQPTGVAPREDSKRSMLTVYYALPGADHGLTLNQRMRVELPLAGTERTQKVIPYSAIYYDAKGSAWVYVNPKPYVFERQLVTVERVTGEVAALSEGPPSGTQVVVTGAALLYGAEIFGK